MRIPAALFPFTERRTVKHKYCDVLELVKFTSGSSYGTYVFRANSTYDPDQTGVGHQPLLRDEMATRYGKYTVLFSTIKIVLGPSFGTDMIFSLTLDESYQPPGGGDIQKVMEQYPHTNICRLDRRNVPLVLTKYYSAATEFRTTEKSLLADDIHRTEATSNPGSAVNRFFRFYAQRVDGLELPNLRFQVEITYTTLWQERTDLASS